MTARICFWSIILLFFSAEVYGQTLFYSVLQGDSVKLTVTNAQGSVQWQSATDSNGVWSDIPSATTNPYIHITQSSPGGFRYYRVKISNPAICITPWYSEMVRHRVVSSIAQIPVGDYYAGGIVFYNTGGLGMVVTEENMGYTSWGCEGTLIGGTSFALDSGEINTGLIIAGCSTTGIAAQICSNLNHKGYNDWYLPSKDQLAFIYSLHQNGIGSFSEGPYWSSSESPVNGLFAYQHNFYDGNAFPVYKSGSCYVRAVRTFARPFVPYASDINGNIYDTLHFGTQIWFKQNLKASNYNDGAPIPIVTSNTTWGTMTTPAFCWWNNDSTSYSSRGAYYN